MTSEEQVTPDELETEGEKAAGDKPEAKKPEGKKRKKKKKAAKPVPLTDPTTLDPGETLMYEQGGSWWVVAIGPVLIGAILIMEITGPGQVHWPVLGIFALVLVPFSILQVKAARQHVSMKLTETTLRQGARTIALVDIDTIYPENKGDEFDDWQSAPALGELPGVPRRRRGIGIKLKNGKLAQAWARDADRLRAELSEAHLAIKLGLEPRKGN